MDQANGRGHEYRLVIMKLIFLLLLGLAPLVQAGNSVFPSSVWFGQNVQNQTNPANVRTALGIGVGNAVTNVVVVSETNVAVTSNTIYLPRYELVGEAWRQFTNNATSGAFDFNLQSSHGYPFGSLVGTPNLLLVPTVGANLTASFTTNGNGTVAMAVSGLNSLQLATMIPGLIITNLSNQSILVTNPASGTYFSIATNGDVHVYKLYVDSYGINIGPSIGWSGNLRLGGGSLLIGNSGNGVTFASGGSLTASTGNSPTFSGNLIVVSNLTAATIKATRIGDPIIWDNQLGVSQVPAAFQPAQDNADNFVRGFVHTSNNGAGVVSGNPFMDCKNKVIGTNMVLEISFYATNSGGSGVIRPRLYFLPNEATNFVCRTTAGAGKGVFYNTNVTTSTNKFITLRQTNSINFYGISGADWNAGGAQVPANFNYTNFTSVALSSFYDGLVTNGTIYIYKVSVSFQP